MARRFSRSRFVRPAPKTKQWIGFGVGLDTLVGDTSQLLGTYTTGTKGLRPFTILRTHMDILVFSDQQAATEAPAASFGCIIVTETAASIGITAIPNPSGVTGDPESDWFVWQALSTSFVFGTAVGVDGGTGHHYIIDSKAMRKVGPDDDMAMVTDCEFAAGMKIITNGRQLVQLH